MCIDYYLVRGRGGEGEGGKGKGEGEGEGEGGRGRGKGGILEQMQFLDSFGVFSL